MKLTELFSATGEPFTYYPGFVHRFDITVNASVFLCYLGWKTLPDAPEGWRSYNVDQITQATGLSLKEQSTARKQLVKAGLIVEFYARLEHCLRFKILPKEIKIENGQTPNRHMPPPSMCPKGDSSKEEVQERKEKKGFAPPSLDEVKNFCEELGLTRSDGESFYWGKVGNGWKNGKNPIVSWKGTVRQWMAAGYMPSQKNGTPEPKKGFAQV